MRTRHHRPTLLAATLGLLAVIVAAPPVGAAETKNEGKTGEVTVRDDEFDQDAVCRYAANGDLDKITVKYPYVHSSDNLTNPDRKQWVGWKVVIQRKSPSGSSWSTWYKSAAVKEQATQELIADFSNRTIDVPATNHHWRVRTIIKWYKVGTKNQDVGTLVWDYDWYERRQPSSSSVDEVSGYCIPEF